MARSSYLLFGVVAYLVFFGTFLYLIAFVGGLPWVPKTVDNGGTIGETLLSAFVNLGLVALFGVQHSVMARQGFKREWTRLMPKPIERSTYVLFASLALIAMFAFWRPMPSVIWDISDSALAPVIWALFGLGWLIVLISTFLISHFELFGLQQVWHHMREMKASDPVFRQPLFYRLVRHPIYAGFFIAFWSTPRMTLGHLLLAAGMSAYMIIAIRYEERDLVGMFGKDYEDYRERVGMLSPKMRRRT